ncbi:MAG: hypothetical protein ABEH43_09435, partial [Flavobacteriales bacterium]
MKKITRAESNNIRWIKKIPEYRNQFSNYFDSTYSKPKEISQIIRQALSTTHIYKVIENTLGAQKEKNKIFWEYELSSNISLLGAQISAAIFLMESQDRNKITVISTNPLASMAQSGIKKQFPEVNFWFMPSPFYLISKLTSIWGWLRSKFSHPPLNQSSSDENSPLTFIPTTEYQNCEELLNQLDNFRTIYFPRNSLFYGKNLYKKDHYYDPEPSSPLHPTNILHLSNSSATGVEVE